METTQKKIIIYSTPTCHYCHLVKDYLTEKGFEFEVRDVTTNQEWVMELIEKSGQRGVPVIDIEGEILVGFDEEGINTILNIK